MREVLRIRRNRITIIARPGEVTTQGAKELPLPNPLSIPPLTHNQTFNKPIEPLIQRIEQHLNVDTTPIENKTRSIPPSPAIQKPFFEKIRSLFH